jgi:hypothetical protein
MNEYFKNHKILMESLVAAISEHDDRPRALMPSDEELNAMYESYEEKGQSESEAYRLAH